MTGEDKMGDRIGARTTRATAGPLPAPSALADSFFCALLAERGPANVPTLITSLARFEAVFGQATRFADGARASIGYEVLKRYFEVGGRRAWVLRIVGAGAATAELDLEDRAGAPLDTLTVKAKGPGKWIEGYKVIVADGAQAGTFKLTVQTAGSVTLETWDNITLTVQGLARVNDGSAYIELVNLGSATAAPDNRPATGTFTFTAGEGGVDDNAPAAAAIVGTDSGSTKTGLKAFRRRMYGRGFVCAPDLDSDATVKAELKAQTEAFFRILLTSSAAGASSATAITDRTTNLDAFNAGYYYPRRVAQNTFADRLEAIPLVGEIAALWASVVQRVGPGKAPAGADFSIGGTLETGAGGQPLVDEGVAEVLVANGINPVWDRNGSGAKVWGARAASADAAWRYLHAAYLWCLIGDTFQTMLDGLTYDIADGLFFTQVRQSLRAVLVDLHRARAFRGELPPEGEQADPAQHAFDIQCDETMLSAGDREQGDVRVRAWFRPAGTAETIIIELAKQSEV
jgi:uncharacterized protein